MTTDLAVRRGVNSLTRAAEGRRAVSTIEAGVDVLPRAEYTYVTYLLRRGARDDESEAVYDWRQSGGPPAR